MTTSTILDVTKGGISSGVKMSAVKEPDRKTQELAAEIYGSFMNHLSGSMTGNKPQTEAADVADVSANPANDRMDYSFSPGMKTISTSGEPTIRERIVSAEEQLEELGQQIILNVSEQLGISEDQVRETLTALGLNVFDLLNPQTLGSFVMELKGTTDFQDLLTDQNFQMLLEDMGQMSRDLLQDLGVKDGQLEPVLREMKILEEPQEIQLETVVAADVTEPEIQGNLVETEKAPVVDIHREAPVQQEIPKEAEVVRPQAETAETAETGNIPEEMTDTSFVETMQQPVQEQAAVVNEIPKDVREAVHTVDSSENVQEVTKPSDEGDTEMLIQRILVDRDETSQGQQEMSDQSESQSDLFRPDTPSAIAGAGKDAAPAPDFSQPFSVNTDASPVQDVNPEIPVQQTSYAAVDTVELIRQITREITSSVQKQITTLEMQLNPEHLGKLFVHMTSKEGMVSAHFAVADPSVRAAVEAQAVTIRENLNQAGVKVDSIEVTVGTHEFEQNLEQNARGEAEQAKEQEQNKKRRHFNVDSLDDLSGLMSEEERLAAQIMLDHGNSMNVTA